MPILSTRGAASARAYGLGGQTVVPGNSGILTTGTSYTLPVTAGTRINILVVGGGGGGGGGSARRTNSGYSTGAGGGGSGGNAYALNVPVAPGQSITYTIGAGGINGNARDGVYSSGSNGTAGGNTSVTVNGTVVALATGGSGGLVAPNATGGAAGTVTTGTQILAPTAGSNAPSGTSAGGAGAKGYVVDINLAIVAALSYGASGIGYPHGSTSAVAGTIYGAGGSGGGTAQSDTEAFANIYGNPGKTGAVIIWWG